MQRLSFETLNQVRKGVLLPSYDVTRVRTGIVHLGVGNFHRAHQAVYTDDVLAGGEMGWGIAGVSLRSPRVMQMLAPQDCFYSVTEKHGASHPCRVIGSLRQVICAPEAPQSVLDLLCSPNVKIVSLTITEKGYVWPRDDKPEWSAATFSGSSASALLFIVEALAIRRSRGLLPFTLLSCDNLSANGPTLKAAILALSESKDPDLTSWLETELKCPSTMVDRIVPQPTDDDRSFVAQNLGLLDEGAILTEPFGQWIIEDDFVAGRPDWSAHPGVEFTGKVQPFEEMKLRMLNGAHTAIALFGQLAGLPYVSDVMDIGEVRGFLERFWKQTRLTLDTPYDLDAYTEHLVSRFENKSLRHRTEQIASDTSQKLPLRIVEPLCLLNDQESDTSVHTAVVALWLAYLRQATVVDDPLSGMLVKLARSGDVMRFVRLSGVFPRSYAENEALLHELSLADETIAHIGAQAFVSKFAER